MIRFLGENGFNTYIYAPKDDPYLRSTWKKAYPEREKERLDELMQAAARFSVDFVFALSPGPDIIYASLTDQRLLLGKLRSLTERGCRWVGVFLDDVEPRLVNASDRRRFRGFGEAHVSLLNGVFDELAKEGIRLMFCPTYYANDYLGEKPSENEYLGEIRTGLASGVDVLWTGRKVVSIRITGEDVREFSRAIRRKPFLWDNYPVNDYYGDRPRLNIGAFEGRSPEILPLLAGYVSNPMNQPEASKIPLLTLRDYLGNPHTYAPERSLDRAARRIFGGKSPYDDVRLLVDCTRAGPLDQKEAEVLRVTTRGLVIGKKNSRPEEWRALSRVLASKLHALADLRGDMVGRRRNEDLLSELEPVMAKVDELAGLGDVCLRLVGAVAKGQTNSAKKLGIEANRMLRDVMANRVQALGEVVFDTAAADIGLPPVRTESPLIEFCRWSLKASGGAGARVLQRTRHNGGSWQAPRGIPST
jgi:hyaluronoglucosaminidase